MAHPRLSRAVWGILLAGMLLAGGACALFFLPYPRLKVIANLFSRHGTLVSFTPERYASLAAVLPWLGLALLAAGLLAAIFYRRTLAWAGRLVEFKLGQLKALGQDAKDLVKGIGAWRPSWQSVTLVFLFTLAAALVRLAFVNRPFMHDEAYTFEAFAVRPFSKIITDYSLPNNHVLHTLLVRVSFLLFGPAPLAVRLPALVSGVLLVPLTYFLANRLYSRPVAILSAALVAASPLLIDFSTDARGYTLMALLTLAIFILGVYVKDHKNRLAWLLLAVLAALGFYTLPIMLYPYGMLLLWLLVSALVGDRGKEYTTFWSSVRYLLVNGLVTVLLTVLLYTPILIYSGVGSLISNSFVSPLTWGDFRQTLPVRLLETWQGWTLNVSVVVVVLLVIGFGLGLLFHRRLSRTRFPFQLAALLWLVVTFILQRPNPWTRIWTYLFAPMMIWSSAGVLLPFTYLKGRIFGRLSVSSLASLLAAAAILAASANYALANLPFMNEVHQIEAAAMYLSPRLQPADRIAMDYPMDVPFWYYARLHGISQDYIFNVPGRTYNHVYVIVSTDYGQTTQTVLADRAKDGVFCSSPTLQKMTVFDNTEIYECDYRK